MTNSDKKIIDIYVSLGNNRHACLQAIADLYARGEKVPSELTDARSALRNAHESLRPAYDRIMQKLFGDIPLS